MSLGRSDLLPQSMHHDEGQLDILWDCLKGDDAVTRQSLLQRYANSQMPGAHPEILCDDAEAQVLSVPSPDRPRRHVYARRPGGNWVELT